jgi:hypothetical protein
VLQTATDSPEVAPRKVAHSTPTIALEGVELDTIIKEDNRGKKSGKV